MEGENRQVSIGESFHYSPLAWLVHVADEDLMATGRGVNSRLRGSGRGKGGVLALYKPGGLWYSTSRRKRNRENPEGRQGLPSPIFDKESIQRTWEV